MSQQELAQQVGLTANDICRMERGEVEVSVRKLQALATFFKISLQVLLHNDFAALDLPDEGEALDLVCRSGGSSLLNWSAEKIRRGNAGENYVATLETAKLTGTPYESMVLCDGANRSRTHYDILSFDAASGEPIMIEVKSTAGPPEGAMYFSEAEWEWLRHCYEEGIRYEVHQVFYVYDPVCRGRLIFSARDIIERFEATPHVLEVRRKKP